MTEETKNTKQNTNKVYLLKFLKPKSVS